MAFVLTPENLNFATLEQIFREKPLLELPPAVLAVVPGSAPTAEKSELARVYLETHAVNFGPAVPESVIRLALVLQLFSLAQNNSSILAPAITQRLLAFYNREVFPVVQQQGSPASKATQLCLPLLGQGKVSFQGYELNAADVNDIFSWQPLTLTLPEVDFLVNQGVFSFAETADNLFKLQPLLPWLTYLFDLFSELAATESPSGTLHKLETAEAKTKIQVMANALLPVTEQNLGLLRDALLEILTEINLQTEALAEYAAETLDNLFSSTEPPATNSFTLASALVQSLRKQISLVTPSPTEVVFTRADIIIINKLFTQAIVLLEQLTALAFWSVAQVGKVYNLTPGNLVLGTYYHSALFVPKEMVAEQLEKAVTFIRSTSPNPVT